MSIEVPEDVLLWVKHLFATCNCTVSKDLSTFPAIHEESLDMNLISAFARHQAPVRLASNWIVRVEAHFIGGGRHVGTWEVADIGLMMFFRHKGKVVKSKLALLQSKKLYASAIKYVVGDERSRGVGLGRFLIAEKEHAEHIRPKLLEFEASSRYQAYKKESDQQKTMGHFERRWQTEMYYLFYNPLVIPHAVQVPLEALPTLGDNIVGCRVVGKSRLDQSLAKFGVGHSPSYSDLLVGLSGELDGVPSSAGWRLEAFAADLMLKCKAGLADESPNFDTLQILMNQKARPMSAAASITFDIQ